MEKLISGLLVVVAIIHLLPLSGVLGAERLTLLYGIDVSENNLTILMRHRAVMFGLLGGFLLYAAFVVEYQRLALVMGFVSVLSFLALAWMQGDYNQAVARVVLADVVALVCLLLASVLIYLRAKS